MSNSKNGPSTPEGARPIQNHYQFRPQPLLDEQRANVRNKVSDLVPNVTSSSNDQPEPEIGGGGQYAD